MSGPFYASYGLHGDFDRQSRIPGPNEAGKVLSSVGVLSSKVVRLHALRCDEPGADLEIGVGLVDPICGSFGIDSRMFGCGIVEVLRSHDFLYCRLAALGAPVTTICGSRRRSPATASKRRSCKIPMTPGYCTPRAGRPSALPLLLKPGTRQSGAERAGMNEAGTVLAPT
jgi:hypothetical protein